jgi:hypothetical protein
MPVYLDTRGNTKISIALCARCGVKYPWTELDPDPNSPGLMCCKDGCRDEFDPWRLPSRPTEDITLEWARPDLTLTPGPMKVPVLPLEAVLSVDGARAIAASPTASALAVAPPVSVINQPAPWGALQQYPLGYQVTAGIEYGSTTAAATMWVYLCLVPGLSGAAPPRWPTSFGVMVTDGQVTWISAGIFMP